MDSHPELPSSVTHALGLRNDREGISLGKGRRGSATFDPLEVATGAMSTPRPYLANTSPSIG